MYNRGPSLGGDRIRHSVTGGAMIKTTHRVLPSVLLFVWLFASLPAVVSPQTGAQKQNQPAAILSPQELFSRLSRSVFVVEVLDKNGSPVALGSAVAVTPDKVVTNKHVIEDGVTFRLKQGSKTWPVAITYIDPDHDLCRLTAEGLNAPIVPVRLSSTLNVGERVYSIGAPEGLELTISEGLISGLREFEEVRLIQTSAAISHGSSGGGLFDTRGQLVGITTFFLKEGQNLNFALPGDWVKALAGHRVSLAEENKIATPASQVLSWFQLGIQLEEAGEYEKAVRAFREVIRLAPGKSEAWYALGYAYDALQQYDKAIPALQEAIRLKPDYATAWYGLGVVYDQSQQYDKAIPALQKAIRLKPDSATWNNLGIAYDALHQYDKAIPAYQEAIRLKPDYVEDWYALGFDYGALQQYDKAIPALQEAIRLKPDYATAWYGLGLLYYEQGNRSEVMRVYEKLKTLDQSLAEKLIQKAGSLPVAGGQEIQDWRTAEDLERSIRDGFVVQLRPDNAADLLNKALAGKKRDVFSFFVVSENESKLLIGIDCSTLRVCGEADKAGWKYHGNLWIEAACEVGCHAAQLPPEHVFCYVTLERKHSGTFELYIALPERVGGKPKLSWWKLTNMLAELPTKPT
jgi:tetratricopeptide (TPR) repeat protein